MAPRDSTGPGGIALKVDGRLLRMAQLTDEYYVAARDPGALIADLKKRRAADIFTFVQEPHDREPHFDHALHWDEIAVLPVTTYSYWFDKQIKYARNRLRKAWKSGVEARMVEFSDEFVRAIMEIYNETPLRQGKRNWHYGKDFETVKREHATFLERSEFIGAYFQDELIGFAKVTHDAHCSMLMNIVAKVSLRDLAPANVLIAKSVECVAARNIPLFNYGVWGRRGLRQFKEAQGFECMKVPRYYVPLTWRGALALKMGLHRGLKERMPEAWIVKLADTRARWNEWRYAQASRPGPAGAPVEAKAGAGSHGDA